MSKPEKIKPAPLEHFEASELDPERINRFLQTRAQNLAMAKDSENKDPGIEETRDLLIAAKVTAIEIVAEVADGLSPIDAVNVVLDGDVREAWIEAADGIRDVDEEVADLDQDEVFDLLRESVDVSEEILNEVLS